MLWTQSIRVTTALTLQHRHALAGMAGLALAMGVGRFAFTPILPFMQRDAGITIADGAWLAAANYLGYLMGALAAFASTVHVAAAIRAGLAATVAATLAMALADALPVWLALRWSAGFASAFLLIFISAWSLERVGGQALPGAAVFSGVGAGIFAVGVLCLALEALGAGSALAWGVVGGASLLVAAALGGRFSSAPVRAADAPAPVPARGVARWRLVVCYGLFGYGYIIPATFLPVMGKAAAGSWALALAWPAFGLAACVSTFAAARLALRASPWTLWRGAQLLMAGGVALPALAPHPALVIAGGACVGATFMIVTMVGMRSAKRFAGAAPRRFMAAMTAAFATGQLVGPLTVPHVVGPDADFSEVLWLAAAALAAGVCLLPRIKEMG